MKIVVCSLLAVHLLAQPAGKLEDCVQLFDKLWGEYFADAQPAPAVKAFTKSGVSACGKLAGGNAYYCEKDHTIYYDSQFFDALRLRIARETGTSGEAAPATVLAHEFGHAIVVRNEPNPTRQNPRFERFNGYSQEKLADCYAGAMIGAAIHKQLFTPAQSEEAEQAITLLSQANGRNRSDHPSRRTRIDNFRTGLNSGTEACSAFGIEKLKSQQ